MDRQGSFVRLSVPCGAACTHGAIPRERIAAPDRASPDVG